MLYLDKITIHNFKSFRNATIQFNKGFNCIVGPNGSGKSNICDSLLFALGEGSLRRMRASATLQLVSEVGLKKKDPSRKAYVSISVKGDSEATILRTIKPNGKIAYRLNGTRVTRQQVLDYLRMNNCVVDDTNTITQGEITSMLDLNPKGRRELIDITSGIKEFDDKKIASEKELETVEEKITSTKVMLNERLGFIEELFKEKQAAEKYIGLSSKMKNTNYTILYRRSESIKQELKATIDKIAELEKTTSEISKKIMELDSLSEALQAQRNEKAKSLNERSEEINNSNRKLEDIKREIAVAKSEIDSSIEYSNSVSEELDNLNMELDKQKQTMKSNNEKLPDIEKQIANFKTEIQKYSGKVKDDSGAEYAEKYEESMRIYEQLSKNLEEANREYLQSEMHVSDTKLRIEDMKKELSKIENGIVEQKKKENEISSSSNRANRDLSDARESLNSSKSKKKELESELQQVLDKRLSLREAVATHGGDNNRASRALADKLGNKFHGRAMELCRYDERYSDAVNAAAGARLNYFVVESIDAADRAVKILRENRLGRASFIPLDIISYTETKKIEYGDPLISYIEFENRYAAAFKFIFSNTYLIGDIREIPKGTKHRFVTMEGELLEQSGVVSGGYSKGFDYIKTMAELKALDEKEKEIRSDIEQLAAVEENIRESFGTSESKVMSSGMELENIRKGIAKLENDRNELESNVKSLVDIEKKYANELSDAEIRIKKLQEEILKAKKESSEFYVKISGSLGKNSEDSKALAEKMNEISGKLENLTEVRAALLKENEILKLRIKEIETEISSKSELNEKSRKKADELKGSIKHMETEADILEEEIRAHDKKSSGIYDEIKKIEENIAKNSYEKGQMAAEKEKLERESISVQATKGQLETRLADIMAELSGYDKQELVEGETELLEKELYRIKSELDSMGNVNMRAPEMYDEKSKDIKEVQEKIMTLETERNSVISMIDQLESKKLQVFTDTFNNINKNFKSLYKSLYPEGDGEITLENPKEPFNSGLNFELKEGKPLHKKNTQHLSGGEKSMVMLVLIFAIQMCKPMAFYIFDEIDVALDKENSKKLSALIKQLSNSSQFVVVSHNDTLISYADTAIGVAKREGESKVYGVEIISARDSK